MTRDWIVLLVATAIGFYCVGWLWGYRYGRRQHLDDFKRGYDAGKQVERSLTR